MSDAERQIQQFNDAVIRLENQGQYERALDLAREIRGIVRQTFGLTHPLYATALHNLGKVHSSLGNYERAKSLYREALRIRRRRLGPDHRDVATTINNLGNLYRSLGDYDRAIRLCRRALEIRRRTLGENHSAFAESLHNLATLYRERGDYARAAPLARQALDVCRQTLGEKHSAYAQGLTSLAELHRLRGDYASAEPLVRQALEIFRTVFGENHSDFATGLNNLGNLLHARGDFTAAEPLFQQAIEIQRRSLGEHHPLVAVSGDNLAVLYYVRGDYTRAEPLFQQVLAIRRKALGEDHPDYALALNNLALLYFALGDYNRAEPLWRQAGEVFRRRLGENHPNFALTLNNLATMYQSMGDFVATERYHRQALEVRRAAVGEQHPDYAQTLGNIGYLYHLMADYGRAETLYRQAMEIVRRALGEDHPDFALHLNNLALTHWSQGEYEKAEPLARQANEVQRRALGEDHPTFAIGLNNLANLCMMRGEYRKAEGLLQQTLEIYRRALGEDHSSVAQGLNNLAEVYREMGELDRAESLHRQAIALFSRTLGGEHPFSASSIHNLGLIHAARAQFAEALPLLHREAAIETRLLDQVFAVGSEAARAALLRYIENTLDLILTLAANHLAADPGAVAAALDLVLRRKAIAAEALAAQRDAVLGGRHTVLRPRLERLTLLRRQIARNTLAGPGPEGPQAHREQLASWDAEKDGIEAELARQIPEMRLQQQLDQADHRAVALGLPPGVALVEFARYDIFDFTARANKVSEDRWEPVRPWRPGNYLAFVLRAGEPETVAMIDLGKAAPINQLIADLRSEITEEANPTGLESAGVRLRRLIFDPLRKALGGRDQLLIVPDGDLARLPFEVLPTDDGRCLLDAYSITYLASGRDVLRLGAAPTRTPGSPIVVADPDFDYGLADIGSSSAAETGTMRGRHARDSDLAAEPFDTLPGARVEGEEVARLIGDALGTKVEPWLGAQALESRLKAVSSPWIVHLATHGFFMADQRSATGPPSADRGIIGGEERIGPALENPMLRSGLALAGANGMHKKFVPPPDAEDGLLTAEDVAGLDLIDTELVVLSACETGLGQIRVGEGVFGLRRAFVAAGARALVMSLWKVPDDATRELMSDFYRLILAGKPRAESLRQAQLSVRQRYSQPFFWGAFILQGDPGPLLAQAPVTDQIGG